MPESEVSDVEEIVKDWAISFLDCDQRKHADTRFPIINYDRLIVKFGETKYTTVVTPPRPDSHVVFSAMFANNTPKPQVYALKTERTTKSSTTMTLNKSFTYGANLSLRVGPPTPAVEANAGFKADMTKTKGQSQTFEQSLTWSIDNSVIVPPGFQTKAELVINVGSYDGTFEQQCTFEGYILVTFENKKKEHVTTIRAPVKKLFYRQKGFTEDEEGRPVYTVQGNCKCRYGIEQNVRLTEMPLDSEEEKDEEKDEGKNEEKKEEVEKVVEKGEETNEEKVGDGEKEEENKKLAENGASEGDAVTPVEKEGSGEGGAVGQ